MKTVLVRVIGCTLACSVIAVSAARAQDDIEDPNAFLGAWYRIAFDENGDYLIGDGHGYAGGTWYYYPETGWWRQWFYNEPYDPNRRGELLYHVYIKAVDPARSTYAEIRFNWSTPEWSQLGRMHPPLPEDAPTGSAEAAYMQSYHLKLVDNWFIGTIEPIAGYTISDYNPEWISIDIRGRNAYIYRGAFHSCELKDPNMGACYDMDTGDCYTCYRTQCLPPYTWLGSGSSCSDYRVPEPFTVPVYRFWSGSLGAHFFTTSERERNKLLELYAHVWTDEGVAYYAFPEAIRSELAPVHRFWSDTLNVHFYTISEAEKQKVIEKYAHVWTYEGVAFYAYPEGLQPIGALPVYRFWSDTLSAHFYTIKESEKDKLIENYPHVWRYERVAWYAYQR